MAEAAGRYADYVAARVLLPRLPRGTRVLDFGDRPGCLAAHLRAAGHVVGTAAEEGRFGGAFGDVGEAEPLRSAAAGLADRLEGGAPVLLRLRRRALEREARLLLGPTFSWRVAGVIGLLVPGDERSDWAEAHPHAFALLCALEGLARSLPVLRRGGREVLLLGTRRTG